MSHESFFTLTEEVFALYDAQRYEEALELVLAEASRFPDLACRTRFWEACLLCRVGRLRDAVTRFDEALVAGEWWSERALRTDPDLAPLQGDPDFERVLAAMAERESTAIDDSRPDLVVVEADFPEPPFPLLIALHGRGDAADPAGEPWRVAAELGWLVAIPSSSLPISTCGYAWDDPKRAEAEVVAHHAALSQRHPIDAQRIVLAGFSQGAAVALRLAFTGAVPAHGVIAICPSGGASAEEIANLAPQGAARRVRTALVAGEHDYAVEATRHLSRSMAAAGAAVSLTVEPDMGHRYPTDVAATLERALAFCCH